MTFTKAWKIYGKEGHRQRESFSSSYKYDFSKEGRTRVLEVFNSDKTGTNEYTILRVTRDTKEECDEEMQGQIFDGIFENSNVGEIKEIKNFEEI